MTAMGIEGADDNIVRDLAGEMPDEITSDEYLRITGETLGQTVDLTRWKKGIEALKDYDRLEFEGERSREHLRGSS